MAKQNNNNSAASNDANNNASAPVSDTNVSNPSAPVNDAPVNDAPVSDEGTNEEEKHDIGFDDAKALIEDNKYWKRVDKAFADQPVNEIWHEVAQRLNGEKNPPQVLSALNKLKNHIAKDDAVLEALEAFRKA